MTINTNKYQLVNDQLTRNEHLVGQLKASLMSSYKYSGRKILNPYISDENNKELHLSSLSKNKPMLVFRFSRLGCQKCVLEQLSLIREIEDKFNSDILIISDYDNKRDLGYFKRVNSIKREIFKSKKIMNDETNSPYFFIYNNNRIQSIYFPDDDFLELTSKYLLSVFENYELCQ